MAIAVVASQKIAGATGGTTPTFDSTGANCIAVWLSYGGSPTVSDNKGNTYVASTTTAGSAPSGRWYYSNGANLVSVGTGHTVTIGGGSTASSCVVVAMSGVASGAPTDLGQTTVANVTSAAFGVAITPSEDNCAILQGLALSTTTISGVVGANGWTVPQWTSGATGVNYGSIVGYKIQTVAATVSAGESYATWTTAATGAQNALVFKAAGATGTITIDTPKAFEVHQRSGSTGSIQISGTVGGATEDIEASFNGGAWQTIATAVAAGSFSGTLTGQGEGQGTLTVRKKTTTSVSATVANVGIGEVFLFGGDSRANGRGTNGQAYSHATLKAAKFSGGVWSELTESAGSGTIAPLLATRLMASLSVPVAFIYTGVGGTDVAGVNNTWAKPNAQYNAAVSAVTASTASAIKGALFLLGPNAIYNGNSAAVSLATYRTALDTLATNLAADLPGAPKLLVDVCGEAAGALPPDPRTARDNIRGAVLSAWTNNSAAIKGGPVLIEQDYADNVHPATDSELLVQANRYWLAVEAAFYSGTRPRGPRVNSAQWNAGRNQLTVVFDQALKTGLTHATLAWVVNDVGGLGAMTVSSVAYHGSNPNALVLTTSAAATGANGSTRISFASGDDAVGRVVPLSTDISLPGGGAANQPAEPIYAYAVSEFAATATTVTLTLTTDGSTPAASKTGLSWAFFDQVTPGSFLAPTAKGTGASTNGSGVFSVSITGTALLVGATGYLIVSNTDGTPGQSPAAEVFSGPVAVS